MQIKGKTERTCPIHTAYISLNQCFSVCGEESLIISALERLKVPQEN